MLERFEPKSQKRKFDAMLQDNSLTVQLISHNYQSNIIFKVHLKINPSKYRNIKIDHDTLAFYGYDLKSLEKILGSLLSDFPDVDDNDWFERFMRLDTMRHCDEFLKMAANAYDNYGNTMLGIAAEDGRSVEAVQRLIDMGADIHASGDHKTVVYWAINNKIAFQNKKSFEATAILKCVIENRARIDAPCQKGCVTGDRGMTPLEIAHHGGFKACVTTLKREISERVLPVILPQQIIDDLYSLVADFLDVKDILNITSLNQKTRSYGILANATQLSAPGLNGIFGRPMRQIARLLVVNESNEHPHEVVSSLLELPSEAKRSLAT